MTLPIGTLVAVLRAKGMVDVMVVASEYPLELRPANPWERFRFDFGSRHTGPREIPAACEALEAIEKAKERTHQ